MCAAAARPPVPDRCTAVYSTELRGHVNQHDGLVETKSQDEQVGKAICVTCHIHSCVLRPEISLRSGKFDGGANVGAGFAPLLCPTRPLHS